MIQGQLFTSYFLNEGIRQTQAWRTLADDDPVFDRLHSIYKAFQQPNADEASTEDDLIRPVIESLGYTFTRQKTPDRKGRRDIPDFLLFTDEQTKRTALAGSKACLYHHGCTILEAKRWGRPLDRGDATDPLDTPPLSG